MTSVSSVLIVALAFTILSGKGRPIEENLSRSRRDAFPYLASRLLGFGQNQPDSNLDSQNLGQFGFQSGSSQLNSNGAASPSFPTAPYEGVELVNNGTGLNIAYGIPSSRSTLTVFAILPPRSRWGSTNSYLPFTLRFPWLWAWTREWLTWLKVSF